MPFLLSLGLLTVSISLLLYGFLSILRQSRLKVYIFLTCSIADFDGRVCHDWSHGKGIMVLYFLLDLLHKCSKIIEKGLFVWVPKAGIALCFKVHFTSTLFLFVLSTKITSWLSRSSCESCRDLHILHQNYHPNLLKYGHMRLDCGLLIRYQMFAFQQFIFSHLSVEHFRCTGHLTNCNILPFFSAIPILQACT